MSNCIYGILIGEDIIYYQVQLNENKRIVNLFPDNSYAERKFFGGQNLYMHCVQKYFDYSLLSMTGLRLVHTEKYWVYFWVYIAATV